MSSDTSTRRGAWLWLFGVLCLLLVAGLRWPEDSWLATDIRGLLPEAPSSVWEKAASEMASARYEGQLLLVVRSDDRGQSQVFLDSAVSQLVAAGYADPDFGQVQADRWNVLSKKLDPYRISLLTAADRARLQSAPEEYLRDFQRLLYSPLGGSWLNTLPTDLLGLYRKFLVFAAPTPPQVIEPGTAVEVVQILPDKLGLDQLPALYELYLDLGLQARSQGVIFHSLGAPLYTAYGVTTGRQEMYTIGLVSLLALTLLLLWFLRSPQALMLSLVCVAAGVAGGLVFAVSVLQQIHLLTLVFGATLIGIAADYAFHYFAHSLLPTWDREQGLASVLRGLTLSVLSSSLAFIALALLPFPGVRQIGIFMASGLLCSYATVCLLFPALYRGVSSSRKLPDILLPAQRTGRKFVFLVAVLAIALPGILLLHSRDDVRDFYAVPAQLAEDEKAIIEALGLPAADSRFLLLEAPDEDSLLRLEEKVLVANETPLRGITSLVPSIETQLENIALQQRLLTSGVLDSHLHALGLDGFREAYKEQLLSDFDPLTIASLEGLTLPLGTGGFVGCDATGCASWMGLAGVKPEQLVALESSVTVVDQVGGINRMLGRYREGVALMLVSGILAVLIFLGVVLGWRRALNIVLVPTVASLLSLAVIGYTAGGYSIINLLGLLLVIGVSLDYAIFRVLTPGPAQAATSLAISLSAMTSLLAFGMLALSRTPVISDFGQTIALGLVFALWLSWTQVERSEA